MPYKLKRSNPNRFSKAKSAGTGACERPSKQNLNRLRHADQR